MTDKIPIVAAETIGKAYHYDQVVIYARRVGDDGIEWVTTWGRNRTHCDVAARIGATIGKGVVEPLETMGAEITRLMALVGTEAEEAEFDWNPVDALEAWLNDCAYEDAADDLVDVAALNDAWVAWKAKQSLRWWNATRKIRIVGAGDPDAHLRYPPTPGPGDQPAGACDVFGGTGGGAA